MKKTLLFTACLVTAAFARAQQADSAKAIVHYKFSWVRDTTKRDSAYKENMILFLGRNASVYKSYDRQLQNAMLRKEVAAQVAANGGPGGGPIKINRNGRATSSAEYYQFAAQNKLVRNERLVMNSYLIEEPIPLIKWKISADTANFAGLHCQKATAHFKGRDYTAWFCPDLPFHSGPWKLNGLPGLIVEAYDTKKEVVFKFDGMEDPAKMEKPASTPATAQVGGLKTITLFGEENNDPSLIALPADGIKASEKEFANLREAMRKDPQAFANSAMAGMGAKMNMGGGNGPAPQVKINISGTANGPVINNPIELPEKP